MNVRSRLFHIAMKMRCSPSREGESRDGDGRVKSRAMFRRIRTSSFDPRIRWPLAAALVLAAAAPASASEEFHLTHDGADRAYHVYIPASYTGDSPVPLVVALHGRGSSGTRMENLTGLDSRADASGFIVVYPDGLNGAWDYVYGLPGYQPGPNDAAFLLELVDTLTDGYDIDPHRIYVTGLSNGGFMTQRMACYAPARFAAFASVAASGYGAMLSDCKDYQPVNILYIHGTSDRLIPWRGFGMKDAAGNRRVVTMSVKSSLQFWAQRNGCAPQVVTTKVPQKGDSPGTAVELLTARECEDGAEVSLYAVLGGGHNWPGVRGKIPRRIAGRVNMDINASDVIVSFFERNGMSSRSAGR